MKKVVVISSTPRIGGNSEVLAKQFCKGAEAGGNQVEFVSLRDYNIKYCIGCYACRCIGKCVFGDGMDKIAEKLINADVIVFATPVYFYSMSGQLKVFIDRLTPYYEKIHADIYMIATQWDSDEKIIENTFNAIRGLTKYCFKNCQEKGLIYGAGLSELGDAEKAYDLLDKAYKMGQNV